MSILKGNQPLPTISSRQETPVGPQGRDSLELLVEGLRHPEFSAIREAIQVLDRLPKTESGYTTGRPGDFRRITEALADFLKSRRRLFLAQDPEYTDIFFQLVGKLRSSQIKVYPNEVVHLDLVHADALLAVGKAEAALQLLQPMSTRPYLIEGDFLSLFKLFLLDTTARLSLGKVEGLSDLAFARLKFLVRWRPTQAPELFDAMMPALALGSPLGTFQSLPQIVLRKLARTCLKQSYRATRSRFHHIAHRFLSGFALLFGSLILILARFSSGGLQLQPKSAPSGDHRTVNPITTEAVPNAPLQPGTVIGRVAGLPTALLRQTSAGKRDVLVTRAMGGLGDIMMMTPGLHSLAKKLKRPVHFATKRQFFPIVENNPDIVLLDIDGDINLANYRRWSNLSICPAGAYESRVRPDVKKGRVELFAAGMGIDEGTLKRSGLRPRLTLSFDQVLLRDQTRARLKSSNRPIVGIQPYSRDTYKNYPHMLAAAEKLAQTYTVIILHNAPVPIAENPNIVMATDLNLRQSIATVAACDYFISVDSAFYHIAAAFDIPTLGIFGPTSGKTFSKHHPRHRLVSPPVDFPCVPCWRNEDIPCYLTNTQESSCLSSITVASVLTGLQELERAYPLPSP